MKREDMMRITTDDGTTWDAASALRTTADGIDPVELSVGRIDINLAVRMLRRIGKPIAYLATEYSEEGYPVKSFAVGGTLHAVRLAPYDSQSDDAARDCIVIAVEKMHQL